MLGWLVGVVFVPPLLHWLDGWVKSDSDKLCVLPKAKQFINSQLQKKHGAKDFVKFLCLSHVQYLCEAFV